MDRTLQARLEHDPLMRTATEWFFELRSDQVPVERIAAWQQWLGASPAHGEAFGQIESFWQLSQGVKSIRWPTDEEVAQDGYPGTASISEWHKQSGEKVHGSSLPQTRSAYFKYLGIAASLIAVIATLGWIGLKDSDLSVETPVGETRTFSLADGSTVSVGGLTALKVRLTEGSRQATLNAARRSSRWHGILHGCLPCKPVIP